jgi:DNA-binding NarL/FixJ family response regulator
VIRVVLADDQALVRAGFRALIDSEDDLEVVGEAGDGREAVDLTRRARPDIVLMDIAMPARNGIEATRLIRANDAGQHVVIYTGSDAYEDVARADEAGATGFLHKEALTSPDLADALHVLHTNYVRGIPDPD